MSRKDEREEKSKWKKLKEWLEKPIYIREDVAFLCLLALGVLYLYLLTPWPYFL